jgi:dual specificity MAP kinase phosphatase
LWSLDEARIKNGKVLVHCQAGISRSPTIVIAYLMKIKNLTHDSAYHLVKSKRGIIEPNIFFVSQLFDFEKTL